MLMRETALQTRMARLRHRTSSHESHQAGDDAETEAEARRKEN
jgi:hypothetical protein